MAVTKDKKSTISSEPINVLISSGRVEKDSKIRIERKKVDSHSCFFAKERKLVFAAMVQLQISHLRYAYDV